MAEIYAEALEAKGFQIDRTAIGIGARKVSAPALESGQIDLKPEYIGSGLSYYDKTKLGRIISRCTSDITAMREVPTL